MKILAPHFAQAIWFGAIQPIVGHSLYGRNLITAFEQKYGFVESPKTAAEFDLKKGITFLHGYFQERVVINKIQIYHNGIVVETTETTDDSEAIIEDVILWAKEKANLSFIANNTLPKLYVSHLEVESDVNLERHVPAYEAITTQLKNFIASYGDREERTYEYSGLVFQIDPTITGPSPFKFERRSKESFSAHKYYSSAPLRTQDHIKLIETLDSIIRA